MVRVSLLVLLVAAVISPAINAEILGTPVTIDQYPSLAQVEIYLLGTWTQQCAGAIITNYHILSSAYCFSGELYIRENRRVRVGATYRYEDTQVIYVQYEYNHPDFGVLGKNGDISVVRLYNALIMGSTVRQVPILGEDIELPTALPVEVLGWGSTTKGGRTPNNQLHRIGLYTHNYDTCMEQYMSIEEPEIITENMICVGLSYNHGRDFDSRDIGAPVFYDNTLIGLLSFGKSDAEDQHPVVATNVGYYSNWIVAIAID